MSTNISDILEYSEILNGGEPKILIILLKSSNRSCGFDPVKVTNTRSSLHYYRPQIKHLKFCLRIQVWISMRIDEYFLPVIYPMVLCPIIFSPSRILEIFFWIQTSTTCFHFLLRNIFIRFFEIQILIQLIYSHRYWESILPSFIRYG